MTLLRSNLRAGKDPSRRNLISRHFSLCRRKPFFVRKSLSEIPTRSGHHVRCSTGTVLEKLGTG